MVNIQRRCEISRGLLTLTSPKRKPRQFPIKHPVTILDFETSKKPQAITYGFLILQKRLLSYSVGDGTGAGGAGVAAGGGGVAAGGAAVAAGGGGGGGGVAFTNAVTLKLTL